MSQWLGSGVKKPVIPIIPSITLAQYWHPTVPFPNPPASIPSSYPPPFPLLSAPNLSLFTPGMLVAQRAFSVEAKPTYSPCMAIYVTLFP